MNQPWYEAERLPVVHADAFGGRVFLVDFDDEPQDEPQEDEMGEDRPEDADFEEDMEEAAKARAARTAYLVGHPNGQELWTRGEDMARSLLRHRGTFARETAPTLFD